MRKVARLTDLFAGVCVCHLTPIPMTGTITTSSGDVNSNELGVARLGDIVVGACGHTGVISSASDIVKINEIGVARIDDTVTGCLVGTIVSGSDDTFANS